MELIRALTLMRWPVTSHMGLDQFIVLINIARLVDPAHDSRRCKPFKEAIRGRMRGFQLIRPLGMVGEAS